LVGQQEGHLACKNYGGMVEVGTGYFRWSGPSRMVSVSASVNLPLHHKVRSSLLALAHPGWSRKKGRKTVVVVVVVVYIN